MRVLTFDQSTRTGWAFGIERSDDRWDFGSFRLPKRDDNGERLVIFRDGVVELIETKKPDLIAHEEPYFPLQEFRPTVKAAGGPAFDVRAWDQANGAAFTGKGTDDKALATKGRDRFRFNPATVKFLLHIQGVLMEVTARYSLPTHTYTSAAWRKTALGFGRAKGVTSAELKASMIQKARALGYAVKDDNEADAIGILMHELMGPAAAERAQPDLLERAVGRL